MTNILIIAPHPDDETLGCGGYLLKARQAGASIHWAIVTEMTTAGGYTAAQMAEREELISRVGLAYKFSSTHRMKLPAGQLDLVEERALVLSLKNILDLTCADTVLLPFDNDVHGDHRKLAKCAYSATKWFRSKSITKIMAYETPSETDFNISTSGAAFRPNVFENIENQFDEKMDILNLYSRELRDHPFPRSKDYVKSLAILRGGQSGFRYAEGFMLLREYHG